jgi:YVTN family beta-propeller protein
MLYQDGRVYVLNSGITGPDSTMSVINTASDAVVMTVNVGDNPSGIAEDFEKNIWILSAGRGIDGAPAPDDTRGRLVRYNITKETIDRTLEFPTTGKHPTRLVSNNEGDRVYYLYDGAIYRFILEYDQLDQQSFYRGDGNFYGLGYDPKIPALFASDPKDFVERGKIYVVRENTLVEDIFDAGIIPVSFAFVQ